MINYCHKYQYGECKPICPIGEIHERPIPKPIANESLRTQGFLKETVGHSFIPFVHFTMVIHVIRSSKSTEINQIVFTVCVNWCVVRHYCVQLYAI